MLAHSGTSSNGKSTLLRILAVLEVLEKVPYGEKDSISFAAKSMAEWKMPQYRTRSYAPQNQAFPDETVEECFKRVFTLKPIRIIFDLERLTEVII